MRRMEESSVVLSLKAKDIPSLMKEQLLKVRYLHTVISFLLKCTYFKKGAFSHGPLKRKPISIL